MAFTPERQAVILNTELTSGDFLALSTSGTSETTLIARQAVGGWSGATTADVGVKTNTNEVVTSAASGAGTVTHWCIMSAASGGFQRTRWRPLDVARTVALGDMLRFGPGTLAVTLGPAD